MAPRVYYNENNSFAAEWLRELIKEGLIPDGEVDTRSIADVRAADLRGFSQCHFFAGIGGWPYALRLAGWQDEAPAWTGSCPCQPFSAAGLRKGHGDERHLWPAFHALIAECRPPVIFGEQVAGPLGRDWLSGVRADLEADGYAVGAANLPACSVGAPHIRYRHFWVADAAVSGREKWRGMGNEKGARQRGRQSGDRDGLDDTAKSRRAGPGFSGADSAVRHDARLQEPAGRGASGSVAHPDGGNASAEWQQRGGEQRQQPQDDGADAVADADLSGAERLGGISGPGAAQEGLWRGPGDSGSDRAMGDAQGEGLAVRISERRGAGQDSGSPQGQGPEQTGAHGTRSIYCADGKWRRVAVNEAGEIEPRLYPLVDGFSNRVGILRGAGNAIIPQVAAEFVRAYIEAKEAL